MYTLKSCIEQRVPAWKGCKECQGEGYFIEGSVPGNIEQIMCDACNGSGGTWHEVLVKSENPLVSVMFLAKGESGFVPVTKTSFLVRRHEVCVKCCAEEYHYNSDMPRKDLCNHCVKNEHGLPTGTEPGTAGEWQVE